MRRNVIGMTLLALTILLAYGVVEVQADEIILRFASAYVETPTKFQPEEVKGPQVFCDLINKKGAGKVKVEYYPSGQLFKDKDMMTAIPGGSLDMGITNISQWSALVPAAALYELPFFYKDDEHIYKVLHSKAGEMIAKEFEQKGIKFLGLWRTGPIGIINSRRPLKAPEDLAGLKIRALGKVNSDFLTAEGGSPIFMSASEMFMALQRGTVDGICTTPLGMGGYKLYEVAKHLTVFPNYWVTFPIVISLQVWNTLPDDVKKVIAESAEEVMAASRKEKWLERSADEYFDITLQNGVPKYVLNEEEYKAWKKKADAVTKAFEASLGDSGKTLIKYAVEAGN